MQSVRASGTSTGAERRGTNERPTPPELPYAACFAAVSGAQSRENEASCAGARPAAVYVYSKKCACDEVVRLADELCEELSRQRKSQEPASRDAQIAQGGMGARLPLLVAAY